MLRLLLLAFGFTYVNSQTVYTILRQDVGSVTCTDIGIDTVALTFDIDITNSSQYSMVSSPCSHTVLDDRDNCGENISGVIQTTYNFYYCILATPLGGTPCLYNNMTTISGPHQCDNIPVCTCSNGTAATGEDCDFSGEVCASCDDGYALNETSETCALTTNTCVCSNGTPASGENCTSESAENCQSCNNGYHLTNDECEPNQCVCSNGEASSGTACLTSGNTFCTSCNSGYHLSDNNCVSNVCVCPNGQASTSCSSNGTTLCESCNPGYYLDDGQCILNQCTCDNGTPTNGTNCETHNQATCDSCNTGYHLVDGACTLNQCGCPNGVASSGTACPTNGTTFCTSCTGDYVLTNNDCLLPCNDPFLNTICNNHGSYDTTSSTCQCNVGYTGTYCCSCDTGYSQLPNGTCVLEADISNTCVCSNGTPATGDDCTTNEANICASCNSGYEKNLSNECVSTDVDVAFDSSVYQLCDGQTANVTWNGYHNICEQNKTNYETPPATNDVCTWGNERVAFQNSGTVLAIDDIAAQPGHTRYFICSKHPASKFTVVCNNICTCTNGNAASGTACTSNGTEICESCDIGYEQHNNTCVLTTSTPSSNICDSCRADQQCLKDVCTCPTGLYDDGVRCIERPSLKFGIGNQDGNEKYTIEIDGVFELALPSGENPTFTVCSGKQYPVNDTNVPNHPVEISINGGPYGPIPSVLELEQTAQYRCRFHPNRMKGTINVQDCGTGCQAGFFPVYYGTNGTPRCKRLNTRFNSNNNADVRRIARLEQNMTSADKSRTQQLDDLIRPDLFTNGRIDITEFPSGFENQTDPANMRRYMVAQAKASVGATERAEIRMTSSKFAEMFSDVRSFFSDDVKGLFNHVSMKTQTVKTKIYFDNLNDNDCGNADIQMEDVAPNEIIEVPIELNTYAFKCSNSTGQNKLIALVEYSDDNDDNQARYYAYCRNHEFNTWQEMNVVDGWQPGDVFYCDVSGRRPHMILSLGDGVQACTETNACNYAFANLTDACLYDDVCGVCGGDGSSCNNEHIYDDDTQDYGDNCYEDDDCFNLLTCSHNNGTEGVCECIEVGQRVLMHDGTHKHVEHLVPGDVLRTPSGITTVRSTRRGGRHLSDMHDVDCTGKKGSITNNHAYHCEGEWRLPHKTHAPRALKGITEVVAIETDNYCEDRIILESGLEVETWDGRGVDEWRPHTFENGRRLRCTLKGTWRDRVLQRVDGKK